MRLWMVVSLAQRGDNVFLGGILVSADRDEDAIAAVEREHLNVAEIIHIHAADVTDDARRLLGEIQGASQ